MNFLVLDGLFIYFVLFGMLVYITVVLNRHLGLTASIGARLNSEPMCHLPQHYIQTHASTLQSQGAVTGGVDLDSYENWREHVLVWFNWKIIGKKSHGK